jgi:hypothetical protein
MALLCYMLEHSMELAPHLRSACGDHMYVAIPDNHGGGCAEAQGLSASCTRVCLSDQVHCSTDCVTCTTQLTLSGS